MSSAQLGQASGIALASDGAPAPAAAFDNLLLPSRRIPISLPSWPGPTGEGREAEVKVAQSFARSEGTGAACWDSAVVLAAFLVGRFGAPGTPAASQLCSDPWQVAGNTVLELGAGCAALPSVACACELGAAMVVATDAGSTCTLAAQNMASPDFQGPLGESAACLWKILVAPLVWTEAGGAWGQAHASGNDGDNISLLESRLACGAEPMAPVHVGGRQVVVPTMTRSSKATLKLAEAKLARGQRLRAAAATARGGDADLVLLTGDTSLAKAACTAAADAFASHDGACECESLVQQSQAAGAPAVPASSGSAYNDFSVASARMATGVLAAAAGAQVPPSPSLTSVEDAALKSSVILASDVFHDPRAYTAFWVTAVRHLLPGGVCIAGELLLCSFCRSASTAFAVRCTHTCNVLIRNRSKTFPANQPSLPRASVHSVPASPARGRERHVLRPGSRPWARTGLRDVGRSNASVLPRQRCRECLTRGARLQRCGPAC